MREHVRDIREDIVYRNVILHLRTYSLILKRKGRDQWVCGRPTTVFLVKFSLPCFIVFCTRFEDFWIELKY